MASALSLSASYIAAFPHSSAAMYAFAGRVQPSKLLLSSHGQKEFGRHLHLETQGSVPSPLGANPRMKRRTAGPCRQPDILAASSSSSSSISLGEALYEVEEPSKLGSEQKNGHAAYGEGAELADEQKEMPKETFKWAEAWYPAAVVSSLDPKKPTPVSILGRPLVIWWDRNASKWEVFLDECPHRLAPLSEGRIHESGQLQCSYHGWTFGGDGSCGMIPQATNDRAKASPRACAKVIPSREHQGLLFVWPDLAEGAAERAARISPITIPELDDPTYNTGFSMSDLAYGADTLIENLMDPAHVPFAHHNISVAGRVQGTRDRGVPLNCKPESTYLGGFQGFGPMGPAEFIAPCFFKMEFVLPPGKAKEGEQPPPPKKAILAFHCVPTTPGRSRVFFDFPSNVAPKNIVSLIPTWYVHWGRMMVLDSDHYLLHVLERRLQAKGGVKNWSRVCYVPTTSDGYVAAYRAWQATYGGLGFEWGPYVDTELLPPTPPKEQLMDRNKNHVLHCEVCQGAKRNFERLQYGLGVLSFATLAGLVVGAVTRAEPLPLSTALPAAVFSLLFAVASERLGKFIYKTYQFHDYNHAEVP